MSQESALLRGVIVPMVTPVTPEGRIDVPAVGRVVEHLIAGGVHGIFVLGTTGEAMSVPRTERCTLVEATVEAVAGRAPVCAGIAANCLAESLEAAGLYHRMGVAAVAAHPPFYFPLSDREIETWFTCVADASPAPLLLYNIPQTTRVTIPLEVVERLSAHPRILGIKDSADDPDRLAELLRSVGRREDFVVLVGNGKLYGDGLLAGADGVVPSMGNLEPTVCRALYDAAVAGDTNRVADIQQNALAVAASYQQGRTLGGSLVALKAQMAARGLCGRAMLPPLLADDEEKRDTECGR